MLINNFQNMWDLDGRSVPRKQMGTCCSSSTCQVDQHHQMGHRRTQASHLCSCLQWKMNFVLYIQKSLPNKLSTFGIAFKDIFRVELFTGLNGC